MTDWNQLYKTKNTGWSLGMPALGLVEIADKIPKQGRFLVPGCGHGYDCKFLAQELGRSVVGVDISPLAFLQENKQSNIELIIDDYFTSELLVPNTFDFVFDYTFLCAIDPSQRHLWSRRVSELLKSGGILVTLMYPLNKREGGPPFSLSVDIYHELLDKHFECLEIQECNTIEKRRGSEKRGIWKRI